MFWTSSRTVTVRLRFRVTNVFASERSSLQTRSGVTDSSRVFTIDALLHDLADSTAAHA